MKKFLLISIQPHDLSDQDAFRDLQELHQLVTAYGGQIVDTIVQKREIHDKGLYIGSGKIREVTNRLNQDRIDVVVLNDIIKPGQLFELLQTFTQIRPEIEVWDRVDLILQIFSRHAQTAEARLQIDLAAMRHMGPRIYGMGSEMSRQTGGIGTRGIGETNTELMKRHWQRQIKATEDKLKKLTIARQQQLTRRQHLGFATVSLIGYTNAGKTSLFNRLTSKKKLASNALFVTLDSSTGKLWLPTSNRPAIISDTIGFIQNLPANLVDAFKSTLMEALHADLLIQVIDASDPDMDHKIQVVEQILQDLNLTNRPRIYAFNKIDQTSLDQNQLTIRYAPYHPIFMSVTTNQGTDQLIQQIDQTIEKTKS